MVFDSPKWGFNQQKWLKNRVPMDLQNVGPLRSPSVTETVVALCALMLVGASHCFVGHSPMFVECWGKSPMASRFLSTQEVPRKWGNQTHEPNM